MLSPPNKRQRLDSAGCSSTPSDGPLSDVKVIHAVHDMTALASYTAYLLERPLESTYSSICREIPESVKLVSVFVPFRACARIDRRSRISAACETSVANSVLPE